MAVTVSRRTNDKPLLSLKQVQLIKLLAHLHLEYRRPEHALPLLEGLQALSPDDIEIVKMLAWARLQSHDYAGALENCRNYRALAGQEGEHAPILLLESRALWGLGREQEAQQSLSDYLENRQ